MFPMWPGLLGRLLHNQDHLQSGGTLLHRPGEGRCGDWGWWSGTTFIFTAVSRRNYTEQHPTVVSLQVMWTSRLWAAWRQRSVEWRPRCSSLPTKPYLPLPNTAATLLSATQHTDLTLAHFSILHGLFWPPGTWLEPRCPANKHLTDIYITKTYSVKWCLTVVWRTHQRFYRHFF